MQLRWLLSRFGPGGELVAERNSLDVLFLPCKNVVLVPGRERASYAHLLQGQSQPFTQDMMRISVKRLSQKTLAKMMDALYYVPEHESFKFFYEEGLPDWFVEDAERRYGFRWERILFDLRQGEFMTSPHCSYFRGNRPRPVLWPKDIEDQCEGIIRKLAAIAATFPTHLAKAVENCLQLDGYTVDKKRAMLIPLEGPVSAQEEEDVLTASLRRSGLPSESTVKQHVKDASDLFVEGKYGPSLGQSRNILQAIIDDISLETNSNGGHSGGFPNDTAGRILYLKEVGFLTLDERDAVKSAWHTLCAGSHPGIPERELARIGLVLALEFGQLLLLKSADWSKNGYKAFTP